MKLSISSDFFERGSTALCRNRTGLRLGVRWIAVQFTPNQVQPSSEKQGKRSPIECILAFVCGFAAKRYVGVRYLVVSCFGIGPRWCFSPLRLLGLLKQTPNLFVRVWDCFPSAAYQPFIDLIKNGCWNFDRAFARVLAKPFVNFGILKRCQLLSNNGFRHKKRNASCTLPRDRDLLA